MTVCETNGLLASMERIAEEQYFRLVARAASGEEVPMPEVRETLLLGGRNMAMLRRDVERLRERRAAGADRARADCLDSDLADAETERDLAVETLRSAEAEVSQRLGKLREVVATATAKANGIRSEQASLRRNAEAVLLRTADPTIDAKIEALRREANELDRRRGMLAEEREKLAYWRDRAEGRVRDNVDYGGNPPKRRVAELEAHLAQHESDYGPEQQARLADLEGELERLAKSKYDPEAMDLGSTS